LDEQSVLSAALAMTMRQDKPNGGRLLMPIIRV
jgi:hypothetical protein